MTAAATATSSSGNKVRVVARIRPLSTKEINAGSQETLSVLGGGPENQTALVQVDDADSASSPQTNTAANKRWFELDSVLDGQSSQEQVYDESGARTAICEDLFAGYNASILAYGQTGAGKTFTMGTASAKATESIDESDGIIPRATQDLFATIAEKCQQATVTLSYLELYNEQIRDLFAETKMTAANSKGGLKLRETPGGQVQVMGAVEKVVQSPSEIGAALEAASQRRVVAATAMNATSSRSHAICTLRIVGTLKANSDNGNGGAAASGGKTKFSSKLTLVDLAGSERIKKTGAAGARQTEGININKSLLVLGQVVSALSTPVAAGKTRRKPPYRDSKLTRLLQDSLGGNSRTIMLACVSPARCNVEETTNTLRYAASARRITNTAKQNVATTGGPGLSAAQATALKQENAALKTQVSEMQTKLDAMQQELEQARQQIQAEQEKVVEAQEQAKAAVEAVAESKRTPPGRTVSRATTISTLGMSSDDDEQDLDGASFYNGDNEPEEVEEVVEEATDTDEQDQQASSSDDVADVAPGQVNVKEQEMAGDMKDDSAPEQQPTPTLTVNKQKSKLTSSSNDDDDSSVYSGDGYGTDLDDDDDDEVLPPWCEGKTSVGVADDDDDEEGKGIVGSVEDLLGISSHKRKIAELHDQLAEYELLEEQNMELQNELAEVKAEADTARMAANYLSDIVDQLRDLKRDEIDKKQQQLQMVLKEQNWISFVHVMLENYKMQVGQLSTDFHKTVVRTVDSLPLKEPEATTTSPPKPSEEEAVDASSTEPAAGEASEEQPAAETTPPPSQPQAKRNRRRSWWGGEIVEPEAEKIVPWKECTTKFAQQIDRIEEMLKAEAESMQSIIASLSEECTTLEKQIGDRQLETQSLFTGGKDGGDNKHDLVDRLSSALMQQQKNQQEQKRQEQDQQKQVQQEQNQQHQQEIDTTT